MSTKTCQFGDCLEEIGDLGIIVTLRTPTFDEEKQAKFCCAAHAQAALTRLMLDRKEPLANLPVQIPRRWRVT
jgi:hypothetical protein